MTNTIQHPLATDYLNQLRDAAKPLSKERREELVSEIEQHLADSLPPDPTEAQVRTTLDRLGDPHQIILAEGPSLASPTKRRGAHEWAAIFLLPFGGVVLPVIGWLIGVLMLWTSQAWTLRDKLIGTLLPPGGYMLAFYLLLFGTSESRGGCSTGPQLNASGEPTGHTVTHCTGSTGGTSPALIALAILLLVLPLITSTYLARRAQPLQSAPRPETLAV
jgi:hypothetical protein